MESSAPSSMAAMAMRIHDVSGRPVEIDRDVLRRTQAALLELCRSYYSRYRPVEQFPSESLALGFQESEPGEIYFTFDVIHQAHGRYHDGLDPWEEHQVPATDSAQDAVEATASAVIDLFRAYAFVLAEQWTALSVAPGGDMDLRSTGCVRRMRVTAAAGWALASGRFDEHMREALLALTRDGVATIALSDRDGIVYRRVLEVAMATDAALQFVQGGPLPLDRQPTAATG